MPKITVDDYIAKQSAEKQPLLNALVEIVRTAVPDAEEDVKWAQPVFSIPEGPFCFMKAAKHHITFGFWWGIHVNDPTGILEGKGEKMRHVKVKSLEIVDADVLGAMVAHSAALNRELGNPTQRKAGSR